MKKNKLKIIYEDKDLLVVSKPFHLLTISNDKEDENTLFHQVFVYLKQKNKRNKVFIVHRLDYDTSGLVIFAKNQTTKNYLQDNWDQVVRKYMAIVNGSMKKNTGVLKSYLKETRTYYIYVTNDNSGKLAITNYKTILKTKQYTLLDIEIKTGRKHQIRVQLSASGNPILGDTKYGPKNKEKRLYLHAYYLKFYHPTLKRWIELEEDVPEEFLNKIL